MEALGGVEPPTCGLGNRRSIHLSYRACMHIINVRPCGGSDYKQPRSTPAEKAGSRWSFHFERVSRFVLGDLEAQEFLHGHYGV